MQIKSPTKLTFWISVVLAVIGLLGKILSLGFISTLSFWFVLVAFVLLVVGILFKGI